MRITKLKIKNLYGIKEIELDGSNIQLTGTNGTGKSSVLDAIRYALENKSDREYIVRNGETEGEILIETDTGLSIDRKKRTDRRDFISVKQNGLAVTAPETFLKGIVKELQLSPSEFLEMTPREQNATILNLIEYPWNLDTIRGWFGEIPADINYDQNILSVLNDIQAENGTYFQTRQDINREIRAKRAVVEEIGASLPAGYSGDKWENVNLSDLYTKIERIRKSNEQIEKAKRLKAGYDGKIRSFEADRDIALAALDREMSAKATQIDTEIAQLSERISSLKKEKRNLDEIKADKAAAINSKFEADTAKYDSEVSAYAEYADQEVKPITELQKEAKYAEDMKSHVPEWNRMLNLQKEVENLSEQSDVLTQKIEKARTLPGEILETAAIPISGLTVKDGIPLINGLPVSNLSSGEVFKLCIDIAAQNVDGLQIILIDGIERLSSELREEVFAECRERGLQFLASQTTDDTALTIYTL